ncbi:tRNA lysidine(34) synthetase TilS [Ancylobacter sp. MQZ15Z-1]|uniref:tRNA(Ile)-lysidine synthase n=1 Tax=Ancylobacter mangrovi TaxID=2972472 RepID=A0A9X2PPU7_9HYPH|nr:tRNA lysidine(34) synthetase TilS [Ancylobacter mangrovi]MCS0497608.1 tRNA lysidine(34) synthetase TilS [Ancylobacter mangrovi]
MPAAEAAPRSRGPGDAALATSFAPFERHRKVLLAVSGGPDSTALMLLASRWRAAMAEASAKVPELAVATVDHGLRPDARAEAEAVGRLAGALGLDHAVLGLPRRLPATGVQEMARNARYDVLLAHARAIGADAIATAHTGDDQAETVLFRLMRGSGLSGLAAIPAERDLEGIVLLRPLLGWAKDELIAVCAAAGVDFARDPSNADPRFARARLRALMPELAHEGLDAARLARLAARMARADAALEAATDEAAAALWREQGEGITFDRAGLLAQPAEIGLRLIGRAVERAGGRAPELAKLEAVQAWLSALPAGTGGARTLAGALIRAGQVRVTVRQAPARRPGTGRPGGASSGARENAR